LKAWRNVNYKGMLWLFHQLISRHLPTRQAHGVSLLGSWYGS